jgi:acid phosphatase (class A)
MKTYIAPLLSSLLLSHTVLATEPHYLTLAQTPDSMRLLAPPPTFDSVAFLSDKAAYEQGKSLRTTPRGIQAYQDADISDDSLVKHFSIAFGHPISAQNTPAIYQLIQTMKEDAGDYATRLAKQNYSRIRPFAYFNEATCRPEDESKLSKNGAYPSGHTAIGWAVALVLAEINPSRQNDILKRGDEMGQSRVICGYHWQSDIHAGKVVAAAVVAALHANERFSAQLSQAKTEVMSLQHHQG